MRTALFGPDDPRFTNLVSWRGVAPREAVADLPDPEAFTKWWGPDPSLQVVTFPLSGGETFVFATTPHQDWAEEG